MNSPSYNLKAPWLADLTHLLCPNLEFRFRTPPDPSVHEAIERSTTDFFVSYRQQESEGYAAGLAVELRKLGYKVFHAGGEEIPSDDFLLERLRQELRRASVLVILGSSDAFGGDWVRWELEAFEEGHWGRMIPLITSQTSDWNEALMRGLRRVHSGIVYEEDEGAWKNQQPSPTTVLCMAIAREFLRVEMEFWMSCASIPREMRVDAYFEALTTSRVCRMLAHVMEFSDREDSLRKMQDFGMDVARRKSSPRRWWQIWKGVKSFVESIVSQCKVG